MLLSTFLIMILAPFAFAERKSSSLESMARFLNSPTQYLNNRDCDTKNSCPEVIQASYEDMYRKGTVGVMNTIISDGSVKNPRTVCHSSAQYLLKMDLNKLRIQMDTHFKKTPKLHEYTQDCEDIRAKEVGDKVLQQAYMSYDFHFKNQALKTALINLIDSEYQIDLMLPGDRSSCSEMRQAEVRRHCNSLSSCRKERNSTQYLEIKSQEVTLALESIKKLEERKKQLSSGKLFKSDEVKAIENDIETIKELTPLLKGERFKSLLSGKTSPTKANVHQALTEQLRISQKEIKSKLKAFNRAHDCLTGKSSDCDDFEEIMRLTKYQSPNVTYPHAPELNYTATFHQCIEAIKDERYKADKVLNDVGINLALTLTPYAVINGAKLAGTLARTSRLANVAKTERAVGKTGLAANIGYGGYHTADEYRECTKEISDFKGLGAANQKLSCSSVDRIFVNNSNTSQCVNQAILSAAFLTPIGLNSLRLAKHLPKIAPSKINELIGKIRNGKSLTKAEEQLLLQKIKEKNPMEKLLNKDLSANDKKFAETTLERLFKKEDVSPEDLLKLSKMVKSTNPPILIISRQDNVDDILKSHRIWGNTEGSTYALTKPAETAWDRVRTGVHSDKEGTFIFTPEAAALFKPHEVEGVYSAIKRAAGQYKGPFGDIIIEDFKKVMVNGRPHVVITKARRAAGSAEEALHAQGTSRAASRLWGRRAGLETVANLGAAAPVLQMYSWYTNQPIDEIISDLLN